MFACGLRAQAAFRAFSGFDYVVSPERLLEILGEQIVYLEVAESALFLVSDCFQYP